MGFRGYERGKSYSVVKRMGIRRNKHGELKLSQRVGGILPDIDSVTNLVYLGHRRFKLPSGETVVGHPSHFDPEDPYNSRRSASGRRRRDPFTMTSFEWPPEREKVRSAQKKLLRVILTAVHAGQGDADLEREARELLHRSMWAVTEIHKSRFKYDQRYISAGAKDMFEEYRRAREAGTTWVYSGPEERLRGRDDPRRCLIHEHVTPRMYLVERLVAGASDPGIVDQVVDSASACLVTWEEERRLADTDRDWKRYEDAKIGVWDRQNGAWRIEPVDPALERCNSKS